MSKSEKMDLEEGLIYLNHAAIGPLPSESRALHQDIYEGFSHKGEASLNMERMLDDWNTFRKSAANLIGGKPEGIVYTSNTAKGLHLVADLLFSEFDSGSNIVLTELEFTTNSYVWQQVVKRFDMELRVVKFEGRFMDWEDKIDRNTTLVAVSHVQFNNGYRENIDYLSKLAHDHDAYISIDAIQSVGSVPVDVESTNIDFLSAGGYKWMLGPLGSGIFYLKPELLEQLDSVLVGWFSDREFHEMQHHPFNPWKDARRFQDSLSPVMTVLQRSINLINEWDPSQTLSHSQKLQDVLIEGLDSRSDYRIDTVIDPDYRSCILQIAHENAELLVKSLKEKKIITSYRGDGIRVSPHAYNTVAEMEEVLENLL